MDSLSSTKGTAAEEVQDVALRALTRSEARLLDAIAARIFPTTDTPGAREAGATWYIDRALADAYRDLLPRYRRGLRALNRCAWTKYGLPFPALSEPQQDAVVTDLAAGRVAGIRNGGDFFELLRCHVLEGVFGEPGYGGNRGMVGWRLVGFPGQQFGYPDAYINRVVDLPPVAADEPTEEEI
jgi:gluconate 2-dehydrogenase gamma chain